MVIALKAAQCLSAQASLLEINAKQKLILN
jgi:hypothetical protein